MKNIKTYEEFEEEGLTFKEFLVKWEYFNDFSIILLDCSKKKLLDLDGIENYTNLDGFWCYKNSLTSLKGLENLINLDHISCWNNKITSLEPIENLINLTNLDISGNKITSLKPIKNLIKLESLYCDNNPIDWIDYVDKQGNKWYVVLPKSVRIFSSDRFGNINYYWKFMDKNQPVAVSRKFNF